MIHSVLKMGVVFFMFYFILNMIPNKYTYLVYDQLSTEEIAKKWQHDICIEDFHCSVGDARTSQLFRSPTQERGG